MNIREVIKNQLVKYPRFYQKISYLINYSYYHWKPQKVSSIDYIIKLYAEYKKNACFVQIGANDGLMQDHLSEILINYSWKGILVEPVSYLFKKLIKNYEDIPRLLFENVAISDKTEIRNFYRLDNSSGKLPLWTEGLGSFREDVIRSHKNEIPDFENLLIVEKINCITFDKLTEKYQLNKIDMIQTDTEGYDYDILKTINFTRYNVEVILFEHIHLGETNYKALCDLLRPNYKLVYMKYDTLAIKKSVFRKFKHKIQFLSHIMIN